MDSESDDGSDVEGFYDAIPEDTLTYKTCCDAMADNGSLLLEIDEKDEIIARLTDGKRALTAEYRAIADTESERDGFHDEAVRLHARQPYTLNLMKRLLGMKRVSSRPRDQLQVVVEYFLSINMETNTRAATHRRSSKHLFAETGLGFTAHQHPSVRMYPYMIFQVKGATHVIVSEVNDDDIKVWCFKPDRYKAAMEMASLAGLYPEDVQREISDLRSMDPYKWNEDQPYRSARRQAREMLGWTAPIKFHREQGLAKSAADAFPHVAKMVVDAFYVRNPETSGYNKNCVIVTDMEPLGKRLYREEEIFDWNDGDFEYAASTKFEELNLE